MSDYKLSANFRSQDFSVSAQHPELAEAIPDALQPNVAALVVKTLQPLRDRAKEPISVLSGYRSDALNRAVGGSPTSQHRRGEAADIAAKTLTPKQLFALIRTHERDFTLGQVILYPTFVHVSLPSAKYPRPAYFEVVGGQLRLV